MNDYLMEARDELKRLEHIIYVSLKYTRTVDVIRNVVDRLISSFDFVLDSLLQDQIDAEKLEIIPQAPKLKCELIEKFYSKDKVILAAVDEYLLLRLILRVEYESENEYRRHVGMIMTIEGKELKVNIDQVSIYYQRAKELIEYLEKTNND